jgi:FkbM family methyltransferase
MSSSAIVHRLVLALRADSLLGRIRRFVAPQSKKLPPWLKRLVSPLSRAIPPAQSFSSDDSFPFSLGGTNFLLNRSDYVQWRMYYGFKDHALSSAISHLRPSSAVFDIGANVGGFSLQLAQAIRSRNIDRCNIYAFEPNPAAYGALLKNIHLNKALAPLISCRQLAIGQEDSLLNFRVPSGNSGAARIVNDDTGLKVAVRSLDTVVQQLSVSDISFIKMIVEGFEPELIKGGWETISHFKPALFLEVTPSWWAERQNSVDDVLLPLKDLGYKMWIEHGNSLVPFPEGNPSLFQYNVYASAHF